MRSNLSEKADFALSFWMVHEVPEKKQFFAQIKNLLTEDGKYLIVEPKIHTTDKYFTEIATLAQQVGFRPIETLKISLSRAMLFRKEI